MREEDIGTTTTTTTTDFSDDCVVGLIQSYTSAYKVAATY